MSSRIHIPPHVQSLFGNLPIESGLTDEEIVTTFSSPTAHKTFARVRKDPPDHISPAMLKVIAHLAEALAVVDAATVISWVRKPDLVPNLPDRSVFTSRCHPLTMKEAFSEGRRADTLRAAAKDICLFDRGDSFKYLCPTPDDEDELDAEIIPEKLTPSESWWIPHPGSSHYDDRPRVSVVLTQGSLATRVLNGGDPAIEELIGNVHSGEHSMVVVDDDARTAHRVYQGVFAEARAVAIFDRTSMFVLPDHQRCVRVVDAVDGREYQQLIDDSLGLFRRMDRFRLHGPGVSAVTHLLKMRLSYRSDLAREKLAKRAKRAR